MFRQFIHPADMTIDITQGQPTIQLMIHHIMQIHAIMPTTIPIEEMVKQFPALKLKTKAAMLQNSLFATNYTIYIYIKLTGYDNTNPMYYEAMRDRFQRGKLNKKPNLKRFL